MGWSPVGPAFVFAPRHDNFSRLSRRNEKGRQTIVTDIAVDPTFNPAVANAKATIYIIEGRDRGSAWRSDDDGASWTPIGDGLQLQFGNPYIDPSCVAVNPDHPEIVYLGTASRGFYVSNDQGKPGSWSPGTAPNVAYRKILVDARTSATPATAVLYAATSGGVFRSADGGKTWAATPVVSGDVQALAGYFDPLSGSAHVYAGVWGAGAPGLGLYYASNPSAAANWSNLGDRGIGLPAGTSGSFDGILVDLCPRNPSRAYAWLLLGSGTVGLYTTAAPTTSWTQVPAVNLPSPRWDTVVFSVAPNSPGNGTNDILVFGTVTIYRSVDGGANWARDAVWLHVDHHAIAFAPTRPAPGTVPVTYVGCDGGLGKSTQFANSRVAIDTPVFDFNETGSTPQDTPVWQNCNRGRQSVHWNGYACPRGFPALSYIASWDSGIKGGDSAATWRGLWDGDMSGIAAASGLSGVAVWSGWGIPPQVTRWLDRGDFHPQVDYPTLNGAPMTATSALVANAAGSCLCGVEVQDTSTTLIADLPAGPGQTATPASMMNIVAGSLLLINRSGPNGEYVTVTAVTATSFTANFSRQHFAGEPILVDRLCIARVPQGGNAAQISQDFTPVGSFVAAIAIDPSNKDVLYCLTHGLAPPRPVRLWTTASASTASAATVWSEISTGKPSAQRARAITVSPAGEVYVGMGFVYGQSPLYAVAGGAWVTQASTGAPSFGSVDDLVADPVQPNVLYALYGNDIYRLLRTAGTWAWQKFSNAGLPGQAIIQLHAALVAGIAGSQKVVLRAITASRGVFETEADPTTSDPPIALYVRDHFLDQGWLDRSPDFIWSPYEPTALVTHYHCADIKTDPEQSRTWWWSGRAPWFGRFYQTDPEWDRVSPLDPVLFDELKDGGGGLTEGGQATVHVQVHNRSRTPANDVHVWTLYCNASAGPPALGATASGSRFNFWSQFSPSGAITPALPSDSLWVAIGPPLTLSGLDAAHPQVASWNYWTIPLLSSGGPGHYCLATFIHSAAAPIGETTRDDIDQIAPTNRQVGLKSVFFWPPLSPAPPFWWRTVTMKYIEFHNPRPSPREVDFLLDLRGLPPELALSFRLTPLETARPLSESIVGARQVGRAHVSLLAAARALAVRLLKLVLAVVERRPRPRFVHLCAFAPAVYEADRSALVEVRGARLGPYGWGAALLSLRNTGRLEPEGEFRFDVLQRRGEGDAGAKLVGGATYVVRIAGVPEMAASSEDRPPEEEVAPPPFHKLGSSAGT